MPNSRYARWLVTFTVPADAHQFKHNAVTHFLDDEVELRKHYRDHLNKDLRILAVRKLTLNPRDDVAIVRAADAANRAEGGDDYRELQGGEIALTQEMVDDVRAEREALMREQGMTPA
jgi:hypothetical protein